MGSETQRGVSCSKVNIGWLTGGLTVELGPNAIKTRKRSCTLSKLCRIQNVNIFPVKGKERGRRGRKKERSVWRQVCHWSPREAGLWCLVQGLTHSRPSGSPCPMKEWIDEDALGETMRDFLLAVLGFIIFVSWRLATPRVPFTHRWPNCRWGVGEGGQKRLPFKY